MDPVRKMRHMILGPCCLQKDWSSKLPVSNLNTMKYKKTRYPMAAGSIDAVKSFRKDPSTPPHKLVRNSG